MAVSHGTLICRGYLRSTSEAPPTGGAFCLFKSWSGGALSPRSPNRHVSISLLALLLFAAVGSAQTTVSLPYELVIQPIAIENQHGHKAVLDQYMVDMTLLEEATQKVLAQAGVRVVWQPWDTYIDHGNKFAAINGTLVQLDDLTQQPGHGQSANTRYGENAGPGDTLNLWFTGENVHILGLSKQSRNTPVTDTPVFRNGALISENVVGSHLLVTVPHEIGHVLGLDHAGVGNGPDGPKYTQESLPQSNLMYGNNDTFLATSISQITSDGLTGYGILTSDQIAMVQLNPLVHANSIAGDTYSYSGASETSDYAAAMGLVALGWKLLRKRRRNHPGATSG